ncbi:MAG: IclR family transcriptional regulator [Candidatus Rokubacteria bacterium]|nr:IclR family transcriptional regulator [Candidatus Rokubacteria bacterium]
MTQVGTRQPNVIQTIARAVDVLYWLAGNPRPVKLSEISRHFHLSKAVAHRLLATLEGKALVSRNPRDRLYSLGGGIATLASSLLYRGDLVSRSQEAMQRLWEALGETVSLNIRIDFQRFCVSQLESPRSLRYTLPLGTPLPLYCGAIGKTLLAMMAGEEIERYLEVTPLVRLGPNTPLDPTRLREELRDIRGRGYATALEETGPGGGGVAAPILDVGHQCVAALGVFAPVSRIPVERLREMGELVLREARAISERLGYLTAPATPREASRGPDPRLPNIQPSVGASHESTAR